MQAPFAGLVSYGLSADLLGELLPLGRALHANTVRRQVQATAQRLEDELGEERFSFIETCQADLEELPRPGTRCVGPSVPSPVGGGVVVLVRRDTHEPTPLLV